MGLENTEQNLHPQSNSFFIETQEDDDLTPIYLSADQGAQNSVVASLLQKDKANLCLTITTIMKTIIGAGILSLPYTVSRLGYILTLLTFIVMLGAAQLNAILLLKAKNLSRHSNYSSLMHHIFRNKFMQILCSSLILIGNIGVCIAELTLTKAALKKIIDEYVDDDVSASFYTQKYFIVIVVALLQLPFVLASKIEKLKIFAFIGIQSIVVFIVSMAINFVLELSKRDWACSSEMVPFGIDFIEILAVIPNIMLSLCYHMNLFPVFKALRNSNDAKMSKASLIGLVACSFCYIFVGMMGACRYGRQTEGNFLLNLKRGEDINEPLFIIMNFSFLLSIFCSFPLLFFGGRNNFISIVKIIIADIKKLNDARSAPDFNVIEDISTIFGNQKKEQRYKKAKIYFYACTLFLFGGAVGIGIAVDSIESVFNIVGAISSNSIGFLFPTMFYFMQIRKKHKAKNIYYYLSWAICLVCIPLGIIGVVSNFLVESKDELL